MQLPISVIIITKNEAHNIQRCLESVKFAREIVIVDSGSTDGTLEICQKYTNKIFINANWQGFGYQKNLALSHATEDWVLTIDADELVSTKLADEIANSININSYYGYLIPFNSYYCGRLIRHGLWRREKHLRLFKRQFAKFSDDRVHEHLLLEGEIGNLSAPIVHHTYANLEEVVEKMNRYSTEGALLRLQKGKTGGLSKALLKGLWTFIRSYFLYAGFLDGTAGFMLAISAAETTYYTYLKLGFFKK